jgi:hypothetical protein
VEDLNGYVILAGVILMLAILFYAGYTDLVSRIRKRQSIRGQRRSAASRRQ